MEYKEKAISIAKPILFFTGIGLVISGSVVLIYLATVAVNIIENPESVELVNWVLSKAKESTLVASGHLNENSFEVQFGDTLQFLFLGIIGLVMVSILVTLVSALVSGGVRLLLASQAEIITTRDERTNKT
jgi:energy-coupling factor transporter transmembrane protein EcfT